MSPGNSTWLVHTGSFGAGFTGASSGAFHRAEFLPGLWKLMKRESSWSLSSAAESIGCHSSDAMYILYISYVYVYIDIDIQISGCLDIDT